MQRDQNYFQVAIGFIVLIISFIVIINVYKIKNLSDYGLDQIIILQAKFTNIEGINIGSNVKISGIKVGVVKDIMLDSEDYTAKITLNITTGIKIPSDSILSVASSGLLGARFLEIQPGFNDKYMSNNDSFISTTSSVNLENILSRFAISASEKK